MSRPPGPRASRESSILSANRVALDINLASAYGNGIAFAKSSPYLVTSDGDGNVRTWHRDTGMQIGLPIRFSGEVTKIRFRPNSDEFAVPAGDSIFLCSVPDPPYDVVTAGYGRRLRGLDVSPRGIALRSATMMDSNCLTLSLVGDSSASITTFAGPTIAARNNRSRCDSIRTPAGLGSSAGRAAVSTGSPFQMGCGPRQYLPFDWAT